MNVLILCRTSNELTNGLLDELNRNNVPFIIGSQQQNFANSFGSPSHHVKSKQDIIKILAVQPIDYVIHLMDTAITTNSIKDSFDESEENMEWTKNILEACVEARVKKIIFPSTTSVYGQADKEMITEETSLNPVLFEGLSKKMEERYIQNYHTLYGLTYSILRFSTIYGDNFLLAQDQKKKQIILQKSKQDVNFIHVKDVVKAIILSLKHADNEIINICSQETISIKELIKYNESDILGESIIKPIKVKESMISIEKAQMQLKWFPTFTSKDNLINSLENYQKKNA